MKYLAFIHTETSGDHEAPFGISFPDFPGCVSDGDSMDMALARGRAALALHIRGMKQDAIPIPEPRTIDAIMADDSLAGWRDGALFVWVSVSA